MDLLVLGGTQFVGRHIVKTAQERGHTVTLFNRGNHPEIFPELEQLTGDRNHDLTALKGRTWDAVIDVSAYFPHQVAAVLNALKNNVEHYTLVSSIAVYADLTKPFLDENAPVESPEDESVSEVTGETYGGLKVACERVLENAMPNRALTVRPGLVVGPYDHTDRFTYWVHRVAQGGDVLAPNSFEYPVQFIDARDLAEFTVKSVEASHTGTFNVVEDPDKLTLGELLETAKEVSGSDAEMTWVSEAFLLKQDVTPWSELPLWMPGEDIGLMRTSNRKAREAGLKTHPLAETVRDTLAWSRTRPADVERKAGLSWEREAELLRTWANL